MTQVIINLLNNAAKFTKTGTVTLRAGLNDARDTLEIRVIDTGVGIPEEDLEKIFTKFHQVQGQEIQDIGIRGSGLGLSISRHIVEHYGGTIRAESEVNKGSTFVLTFPLTTAAECAEAKP
nr:ATP-binding protein [Pseudodesulfovibrio aespoeensis]